MDKNPRDKKSNIKSKNSMEKQIRKKNADFFVIDDIPKNKVSKKIETIDPKESIENFKKVKKNNR